MSEFWLGVLQSAIGSGLGFGFGIVAFHYQQKRQSANDAQNRWLASLDALNRLTNTAAANIEALVNCKLQFAINLMPEVDQMGAASIAAFDAPEEKRIEHTENLIKLSNSMRYFYLSFAQVSVMQPPEYSNYSALSKDMPALPLFAHRAVGMTHEINEHIVSRNELIADQARESGIGGGMSGQRVLYFASMLSGQGKGICENIEFALDFWRLVLDQIDAYRSKEGAGGHLLSYELIPKAAEAMPKEELFPAMREQLAKFLET